MARVAGVDLPREKRLEIALTYIYGIGRTRAQQFLTETGVSPDLRVHELGDEELVKLRDAIDARAPASHPSSSTTKIDPHHQDLQYLDQFKSYRADSD